MPIFLVTVEAPCSKSTRTHYPKFGRKRLIWLEEYPLGQFSRCPNPWCVLLAVNPTFKMPRKCPSRVGWQGSPSAPSLGLLGQPRAQPIAVARVAIGGHAPVPRARPRTPRSHWDTAIWAGRPWLWLWDARRLAQEIPWISKWWRLCEVETGWNWQELWVIKIGRSSHFTRYFTAGKGGL